MAFAPPNAFMCFTGTPSVVTDGSPWRWSCNGSADGGAIVDCSASNQTTATGSGLARAVVAGTGWVVNWKKSTGFIATSGDAKSPAKAPPAGYSFPHGLLDFALMDGFGTATITITYPSALPANTVYWKYGPSPAGYNCSGPECAAPHWYPMPAAQAVVSGNTVTLTIADGGVGDDDLSADGWILDVGGPGVPVGSGVAKVPTLSEWGIVLLMGLVVLLGVRGVRAKRECV